MKNIILILACLVSSPLFAQKFDKMLQEEIEKSAIFVVEEYFSLANFIGDTQKPIEHRRGNYRRSFLELFTDYKDNTICYNDLIPEFDDAKGFHSPQTYIDNATSFYYQDGFKMNYKNLQIGNIRPHPSQKDHYVISVFLTKEVRGLYMKDSQLSQKFHDLTFFIVFKENQNYVSDFRIGAMEKYKKEIQNHISDFKMNTIENTNHEEDIIYQTKDSIENTNYEGDINYQILKNITKKRNGTRYVLKNVGWYNDKKLRNDSYPYLDNIVKVLERNPHLIIEIGVHTEESLSVEFSQKIAEDIVHYLEFKGINKQRIIPKGYGKYMPLAKHEDYEYRHLNNRVEIKVIEF